MTDCKSIMICESLSFGEGPRRHEGRLGYSDFYRRRIYSMKPDGQSWTIPEEYRKTYPEIRQHFNCHLPPIETSPLTKPVFRMERLA